MCIDPGFTRSLELIGFPPPAFISHNKLQYPIFFLSLELLQPVQHEALSESQRIKYACLSPSCLTMLTSVSDLVPEGTWW